jgi:hypothetical protein
MSRPSLSLILSAILMTPVVNSALAADEICRGKVDHVLLEEGNLSPPTSIIPDKNAGNKWRPQEWNFLNRIDDLPEVTVHCFNARNAPATYSVVLDKKYKHCSFLNNRLFCRTSED